MDREEQTTEPSPAAPDAPVDDRVSWQTRLKHVALTGLAISAIVHLVMLIISMLVLFPGEPGQLASRGPAEPVEFAVMTEAELAETHGDALSEILAEPEPVEAPEPIEPPLDASAETVLPEIELPDLVSELSSLTPLGEASDGAEGLSSGLAGGGGGGASFFGVEAAGSRFAFVVDWSGSMAHGGKVEAAVNELRQSIQGMGAESSFFIALYASSAASLGSRADWMDASDRGKRWASTQLGRAPPPRGGTNPIPGFEMLTTLRPRPDAIYFMTDGEFPEDQAPLILALHSELQAPIHCITFVNRRAEPVMKRIARATGGTYNHVGGHP